MADYSGDVLLSKGSYGGKPVDGYTIDKNLSSPDRTAYVDSDGNLTLAFRGTDLKNRSNRYRDLGTDLLLGLGLQDVSNRFKNSKRAVDSAIEKYGKDKVRLTGHSLGGSQALYLSNKRGLTANSFNAGISPIDTYRNRNYSKATSHTIKGDPISFLSPKIRGLRTKVSDRRYSVNPHSLINFTD